MKIALFTIFRCVNYGAVLQALAVRYVLSQHFPTATIDVINHFMDPRDNHLSGKITNPRTPWFQRWRNKRKFKKKFYRADLFEVRREKTIRVIEEMLKPTAHIFKSPKELASLSAYDVVVVGSDQVWNPIINHDFEVNQYLCTTLPQNQRRVSYAASFGISQLPKVHVDESRAALSKFDHITVREETGASICEELLGYRPEVVLDPTMLISEQDWRAILVKYGCEQKVSTAYLFAYWVLGLTQEDINALSAYANERGMPIFLMSAGQFPKLKFPENVIPQVDASPLDWVMQLASSEGVITDSFHGLQFATTFAKPILPLVELAGPHSNASRLVDFCSRCSFDGSCMELQKFRAGEKFSLLNATNLSALQASREKSLQLLLQMVNAQ